MTRPDDRLRSAGAAVRDAAGHRPAPTAALADRHRRRQSLALRAAIVVLVLGPLAAMAVIGTGGGEGTVAGSDAGAVGMPSPAPPATATPVGATPVLWETGTVRLVATDIAITLPQATFRGSVDGDLRSDPGTPDEYTTLERTWQEDGVELRLNIYFRSDGTDWWADEIRIYDGSVDGEWVTYTGEFFRAPLGQPHVGDLELRSTTASGGEAVLAMRGLEVEAFLPPVACERSDGGLALEALYPAIELPAAEWAGFGASVRLRDADCAPIPDDGHTFAWTAADPSLLSVTPGDPDCPDPILCSTRRADLQGLVPGSTTLRVDAHDEATGQVVASTTMVVTVVDPDDAGPTGTTITPDPVVASDATTGAESNEPYCPPDMTTTTTRPGDFPTVGDLC